MVVEVRSKKTARKVSGASKRSVLVALARTRALTQEQRRVAEYLLAQLSFEKPRHIPQRVISSRLGMLQPNVSRAVRELARIGFISSGPPVGPGKSFRLEAAFVA
jgi:hypothetical protein